MADVILAERDVMLRLLACLIDSRYRTANEQWAAEQLWPEIEDPTSTFTQTAAESGLLPRSVGFVDDGPDSQAQTLVTESVPITRDLLRDYPRVSHIIRFGEAAAQIESGLRNVGISTFQRKVTVSVAEHAVALLLALLRDLVTGDARVREERPGRAPSSYAYNWLRLQPRILSGCTVALLGFGEIGRAIAHRLAPFEARLVYWSRRPVPPKLEGGATHVEQLNEALAVSDAVIVALPLNDTTRCLIGKRELTAIGPSGVLINVSRGAIVDESALIHALSNGKLAGAGLDVFDYEPLPAKHPLRTMSRTILSPHCAGGARALQLCEVVELARLIATGPTSHSGLRKA